MIDFYAYLPSGEIVMTGACQPADLEYQRHPGGAIAQGHAVLGAQYRSDSGGVVNIPPKPGEFFVFDYGTKSWVQSESLAENEVRAKREVLLQQSDWTQLPDVPLETKTEWATYRQELRDITDQPGYPFNVVWPTPPQ
jgi:hypothetical protein